MVLIQDTDTTLPVLAAKVQLQAVTRAGGPWAAREKSGALLSQPQKSHIVHLRLVICLTNRQPDPVDCGFYPMHASEVCFN